MPRPPVPERIAISDSFSGYVITSSGHHALASGFTPDDSVSIVQSGAFIVRYGLRVLGKPHISIVPELVAVDYGRMLNGMDAWDFITRQSNLFPRAEVFGHRNDGKDDMMYVKNLDLALTPEVLVFTNPSDLRPLAQPDALIAPQDALDALPARLRQFLTVFDTPAAWTASRL